MGLLRRRRDEPKRPLVTPGRLVESPSPGGGVERRAFGEFESPRGELASYAFGWVAEEDEAPHEARMTVGIGAGNPGGASIHWRVFVHEGSHAFGLLDEPFERVPQGGPDVTAEAAREIEDLPFVFWVGDCVMRDDPRAVWMWHWLIESWAFETPEVADRREPVLLVVLDDHEDVPWQVIGTTGAGDGGKIEHLHHHLEHDPSLLEPVARLEPGQQAERDAPGQPWRYAETPPEAE